MRADLLTALGVFAVLGTIPLLVVAVGHLGLRDYVGGGLLLFAVAAIGHLGLELLALSDPRRPPDEEEDW